MRHARHRLGAATLLWLVVSPTAPTAAQSSLRLDVFHGRKGESLFVQEVADGIPKVIDATSLHRYADKGTQVCIRIVNPHPGNYIYAVADSALPTVSTMPSLPEVALAALGTSTRAEERVARIVRPDGATAEDEYLKALSAVRTAVDQLRRDLEQARRVALSSDEPVASYDPDTPSSFSTAKTWFTSGWPSEAGRIGDPKLAESLQALINALTATVDDEPTKTFLDGAMKALVQSLVAHRDQIAAPFVKGATRSEQCKVLGDTPILLRLSVASTDTTAGRSRDVKNGVVDVTVTPNFNRPVLEVVPLAYMVASRDVTDYGVVDGVLTSRVDKEKFEIRAGAVLALNLKEFGTARENALGIGVATNVLGGESFASEFFGTLLFSHRDSFRVGLGWGRADFPSRLRADVSVGSPLSPDATLDSALENEDKSAFFLSFSVTGWSLGLPTGGS